MSKTSANELAKLLLELTRDKSDKETSKSINKFILYIYKVKLMSKINTIIDKYRKLYNQENNHIDAIVYSRKKLSKENAVSIKEKIQRAFKSDKVNLENIVNETMSGGIKIKIEDTVIDLSLDNKINQLKNHLIKNS